MCKTLRVLNALRHYTIGMPLTYDEYVLFSKGQCSLSEILRNGAGKLRA